jgi:hypothetical protein
MNKSFHPARARPAEKPPEQQAGDDGVEQANYLLRRSGAQGVARGEVLKHC